MAVGAHSYRARMRVNDATVLDTTVVAIEKPI